MKKRFFILALLMIMLVSSLFAVSNESLIMKGNNLYSNGNYSEALETYNQLLNSGYVSLELYYNIGNSYFKMNKIPDAILFYERAKRISPDDEDLNFNLRVANLKIVDRINEVPKLFFIEWYDSLSSLHSSSGWSYMTIVFSWLTFILLAGYFLIWNITVRKISFFASITAFLITILCIVFALQQYSKENSRDEAIIFAPSVYIKSSPDKESTDLFILHEGTKIKILDEVGNWKKIKIADGNIGWLPDKTIEII
ncbi:tetratricopeptide repeat protein [Bacteroidetes/Chlorobi group bacterium ChocPot_Mid]|jgi:tetratricopeptide (TPR) repeat protein|nr:MAG: tetratricopeptide repeat protein [Bacteroidetes/Chlorobi group bacterium ChocPot_Mid]